MALGDLINAAKAVNLTDEQKELLKKVIKEAAGNKDKIASEAKKLGISLNAEQISAVLKMLGK